MKQERAWLIAIRVTAAIAVALFVVLLGTGLVLTFRYRPTVSHVLPNGGSLERGPILTARGVHRLASELFGLAVGCLALSSIGLFLVRRDRAPVALALAGGVLALVASFTGYLLPWDQLSLWAVTVGSNMQGYTPILGHHHVQYVLLGSREVSTASLGHWFWFHAVVVPVAIAAALTTLVIRVRHRAPDVASGDGS